MVQHLLLQSTLPLHCLLVQQRLNADAARFGSEMAPESIGTREPSPTAPATTGPQVALAHKLLLPAMQTLVSLPVMLAGECFAADGADKRALVGMGPKMRSKIVRAGEALGTQGTLKGSRMLLDPLVGPGRRGSVRVGEFQDVVTGGNGRCGRAARGSHRRVLTRDIGGERCVKRGKGLLPLLSPGIHGGEMGRV